MSEPSKTVLQARLFAVKCMFKHDAVLPHVPAAAISMFKEQWNSRFDSGQEGHVSAVRQFLSYNFQKLQDSFTLLTIKSSGPPAAVPLDVARECAQIVGKGYMQKRYLMFPDRCYVYVEHAYFTSIKDAVVHSPRLQQVLEEYKVSRENLLERYKAADPRLVYLHPSMKRVVPNHVKQERVVYGGQQLTLLLQEPTLMEDTFLMDECTAWVGKDLFRKLHIWCYRGDVAGQPPLINKFEGKGEPFKVNFLLVVSARYGCFYFELLTGTEALPALGRHNPQMRATVAALQGGVYQTKDKKLKKLVDAKAATAQEIMDNCRVWVPQAIRKGQENNHKVYFSWDNASIHPKSQQQLAALGIRPDQLRGPPPYSPDFHEMIEHRFGEVKEGLVVQLYKAGFDNVDAVMAAEAIRDLCIKGITAAKVAADIPQQIFSYQVVSAPVTTTITKGNKSYQGTNGGYGPKGAR